MKIYVLILSIFLVPGLVEAQDSTKIHIKAPKIITKLYLGKNYQTEDVQIKFADVLSDSRCPEDVTCVWTGQVVALVEVYKNKILIEKIELVFEPGKNVNKELRTLFNSEKKTIIVNAVLPYPNSNNKIKKEDYYLQLEISN